MDETLDKTLYKTLLYDFYGELLSEKQKRIYEMYHLNDFSLMEISECVGISRQGVRDVIVKCEKAFENYEQKLSLVSGYLKKKQALSPLLLDIEKLLSNNSSLSPAVDNDNIYNILEKIKNYLIDTIA